MEKKPISSSIAGLLLGLISAVSFIAFFYTGNAFSQETYKWIPTILIFIGIIFFVIKFAKDRYGNVTFGNCFGYGFKVTAVYTIITIVVILALALINPELKAQFLANIETEFNKPQNSQLTAEQKTETLKMMDKMFYIMIVGGTLISNVIMGLIASLIGAAVAKKNPNPTPFNQELDINR